MITILDTNNMFEKYKTYILNYYPYIKDIKISPANPNMVEIGFFFNADVAYQMERISKYFNVEIYCYQFFNGIKIYKFDMEPPKYYDV